MLPCVTAEKPPPPALAHSELVIFTRRALHLTIVAFRSLLGQALATEAIEEKPVQLGEVRVQGQFHRAASGEFIR